MNSIAKSPHSAGAGNVQVIDLEEAPEGHSTLAQRVNSSLIRTGNSQRPHDFSHAAFEQVGADIVDHAMRRKCEIDC
jgi:hypothetical protein